MKRLSVLLLVCGITSIAQGMDAGAAAQGIDAEAARRIAMLESLNALSEINQTLKLWQEFTDTELIDILTVALAAKLATTGEIKYGALLRELRNPHYSTGEKTSLLSFQFKPKELIKILQRALLVKIYGDELEDMKDMEDMKE